MGLRKAAILKLVSQAQELEIGVQRADGQPCKQHGRHDTNHE